MNIEIAPKVAKPVNEFDLRTDGEIVGTVETCGDDRWRSMLSLQDRRLVGSQMLFGYGATHEEAIADAIRNGHEQLAAITERLAELEEKVLATAT